MYKKFSHILLISPFIHFSFQLKWPLMALLTFCYILFISLNLLNILLVAGCDNLEAVEKYQNSSDPEDKKCVPEYYTDALGDLKELMGDGLKY